VTKPKCADHLKTPASYCLDGPPGHSAHRRLAPTRFKEKAIVPRTSAMSVVSNRKNEKTNLWNARGEKVDFRKSLLFYWEHVNSTVHVASSVCEKGAKPLILLDKSGCCGVEKLETAFSNCVHFCVFHSTFQLCACWGAALSPCLPYGENGTQHPCVRVLPGTA
jgi:hypothetical protein